MREKVAVVGLKRRRVSRTGTGTGIGRETEAMRVAWEALPHLVLERGRRRHLLAPLWVGETHLTSEDRVSWAVSAPTRVCLYMLSVQRLQGAIIYIHVHVHVYAHTHCMCYLFGVDC